MYAKSYAKLIVLFLFIVVPFKVVPLHAAEHGDLFYQSESEMLDHPKNSAIWLSGSLGEGKAFDMDRDDRYYGSFSAMDMSVHLRYHDTVISGGVEGGMFNEVSYLNNYYIACGKSVFRTIWQEVIVSAGISRNELG